MAESTTNVWNVSASTSQFLWCIYGYVRDNSMKELRWWKDSSTWFIKIKLQTWRPSWIQPVPLYKRIAQDASPTINMTPFEMSYITGCNAMGLLTINHTPTILLCNFTEPHEMHMANSFLVKCGVLTAMTSRITVLWDEIFRSSFVSHMNEDRVGVSEITTIQNFLVRCDRTGSTGLLHSKINPFSNYSPCGFILHLVYFIYKSTTKGAK